MGTRDQLKYAQKRLETIYGEKRRKIQDEITPKNKKLTPGELIAGIKSGKIKALPNSNPDFVIEKYTDITSVFDISEFLVEPKLDQKAWNKRAEPLQKEFNRVMDELMLGDMEKALKLLQEFTKISF